MGRLIIAAGLLSAACAGAAAGDLAGTYNVRGTTLEGDRYSGTAEITMSSKDTCRMVWHTGGGEPITGFCMWDGSTLAASYQMDKDVGIVIYKVRDDGALDGEWTIADKDGVGTEVLIPQTPKP